MKNKWKVAFFILLGVVGILIVTLFIMASTPFNRPETDYKDVGITEDEHVSFLVRTNKADLNKVINHYLVEEGFTGPIEYQVFVKDHVELYGTVPVFGQNLEMLLTFEPQALENGDLLLKQKSISIGALNLPVTYVMKIIQQNYKLPNWVVIEPNNESIYVSLQEMELKSDIKVRANSFNLKRDDISFTLWVPVK
ncbi:YpmS family protein [Mesobacillus maritimus]|uniref:YpmS family protein n=1 Tax=Mesobacillus maritimus TaxID=1643336 RepID=A0ABS7K385_9BACI|nr:YpmS family protein [Mesobacillus maritimus]MBY0096644.1 YpmS family protein [Mesobacillus maritimus]